MLAFDGACRVLIFFLGLLGVDGIIVMAPFRDVSGQVMDSQGIRLERAWGSGYRIAVIITFDIMTNQIFG
jgi:hypothetical protein